MSRGRWVELACIGGLILLGLRPIAACDRIAAAVVGWLALPYQLLGDAEAAIFGGGMGPSAERAMAANESSLDLRIRELASAVAASERLREKPGVPASVRARNEAEASLEIDCGTDDGVFAGLPVTYGDSLVGIVEETQPRTAKVRLLSHRSVRLTAVTREADPMHLVAAGAGEGRLRVAVAEHRTLNEGALVEVAPSPDGEGFDAATGFFLGRIRFERDVHRYRIDPLPGAAPERLLQVIVRTPSGNAVPAAPGSAESWERVDLSLSGDGLPGRASALGRVARRADAEVGAAVMLDGWLLGRVERRGGPTIRVRDLDDPGFSVDAIFLRTDGAPIPLGRISGRGTRGSALVFETERGAPEIPAAAHGILLTGNGDPGVPKGIRIGAARAEQGRLLVERPVRAAEVTSAWVATR